MRTRTSRERMPPSNRNDDLPLCMSVLESSGTMSTFLVLKTAVTSVPKVLAIWTANVPTPPDALVVE